SADEQARKRRTASSLPVLKRFLLADCPQMTLLGDVTAAVRKVFPLPSGPAVEVPHDFAFPDRHLGGEQALAGIPGPGRIQQAELSLVQPQNTHIGFGARIQVAELRPLDLPRRI